MIYTNSVSTDYLSAGSLYYGAWSERELREMPVLPASGVQRPMVPKKREPSQAQSRAQELLRALLSDEQWQDYSANEHFDVVGSLGNVYRIRPGSTGNVRLLAPNGQEIAALCAHPQLGVQEGDRYLGSLPNADVAVGQLLALTTDERSFFRRANRHWARDGAERVFAQLAA